MTAHVTTKLLQLNAKTRMVDVSNNGSNLKIYLDFSSPVLNSSAEILSALHTSTGVLVPILGKFHGNRRFRFKVSFHKGGSSETVDSNSVAGGAPS